MVGCRASVVPPRRLFERLRRARAQQARPRLGHGVRARVRDPVQGRPNPL